jgi:hypothetical protein
MRYDMALRQLSRHRIVHAQFARSAVRLSFNTYQRIRLAHKMSGGHSIHGISAYLFKIGVFLLNVLNCATPEPYEVQ